MNLSPMLRRFRAWRESGRTLVLASVYETAGSTYSKAGTHMLIEAGGDFQGLLSGGCLEGDLAERAAAVAASGRPQAVTYELGGADDELFGLGVGCDGTMRIFLQALVAPAYEPFASVAACLEGDEPAMLAIVIDSASPLLEPGASTLVTASADPATGMGAAGLAAVTARARRRLAAGASGTETLGLGEASATDATLEQGLVFERL